MNTTIDPTSLLLLTMLGYVIGSVSGLVFCRYERLANFFSFGFATMGGACGTVACALSLATGTSPAPAQVLLLPPLIPYVQFTMRMDALGSFFGLIVSLLGFALSLYSLGYARGF